MQNLLFIARRSITLVLLAVALAAGPLPVSGLQDAQAQVQRRNPTLVHARNLVGSGRHREAIPVLRKFLQTYPSNLEGWTLLGVSYRRVGNFQAAFRATQEALRFQPNHPPAIENLGMIYLDSNRIRGAEEQLARLRRVCRLGCVPRTRLEAAYKKAVARGGGNAGRNVLVPRQ